MSGLKLKFFLLPILLSLNLISCNMGISSSKSTDSFSPKKTLHFNHNNKINRALQTNIVNIDILSAYDDTLGVAIIELHESNALYIKPTFSLNLPKDAYLKVSNPAGTEFHIHGATDFYANKRGLESTVTFTSKSIDDERIIIEVVYPEGQKPSAHPVGG